MLWGCKGAGMFSAHKVERNYKYRELFVASYIVKNLSLYFGKTAKVEVMYELNFVMTEQLLYFVIKPK